MRVVLYSIRKKHSMKGYNEMTKTICKKVYDTASSTVVKKTTYGYFGSPDGYEETLYVTKDGNYFFYTNGGSESKYKKEDIKRASKATAEKWLSEH